MGSVRESALGIESVFELDFVGVRLRLMSVAAKLPYTADLIDWCPSWDVGGSGDEHEELYALVCRRQDRQYITYHVVELRDVRVGGYRTWFEEGDYGFRKLSEAALDLERRAGVTSR